MSNKILINSRKFDGSISKSWVAELVERTEDLIVVRGVFEFDVDHRKLGFIKRGTISHEYYWPGRWYNVFRFLEPDGELRNFYCNVASPPEFDGDTLDYVDYDIDVLTDAELNYEVLDMDEFEERKLELGYTADVIERAEKSLAEIIELIERREFPFD